MALPPTIGEPSPSQTPNIDSFRNIIERGRKGNLLEVRGGYYDSEKAVWVANNLDQLLEGQPESELPYFEAMAGIAVVEGEMYKAYVEDGNEYVLWSRDFFEEDGTDRLLEAAQRDATFENSYCAHPDGPEASGIPYSIHYRHYYDRIAAYLKQALDSNSAAVAEQRPHFEALLNYYTIEENRDGETERRLIEETERTWVAIPEGTASLPLAGAFEQFQDPLLQARQTEQQIKDWVADVRRRRKLFPWTVAPESRLMFAIDDSEAPVSRDKIKAISESSDQLYGPVGGDLRVISEFRTVPWASGFMAYQQIAKNLPNHEGIRAVNGWRNEIMTNVRDASIQTQGIPAAQRFFDEDTWVYKHATVERLRAAVNIVGHEENHPRWVMDDTAMEEFKNDVLGVYATLRANEMTGKDVFTTEDYETLILNAVIGALALNIRYRNAQRDFDQDSVDQLTPYFRGNTMILKYFYDNGVFKTDHDGVVIDLDIENLPHDKLKELYGKLVHEFKALHAHTKQQTVFFEPLFDERVWDRFNDKQPPTQ